MRILVADDDATNRRVLQLLLRKWNYDVLIASDGKEAWEILQKPDAPRLALLDWMMPEMDGPEICRALRTAEQRPENNTYVLLLTTKTEKEDIVTGLEAGADDYIAKPFHSDELRSRIRAGVRIISLQEKLVAAAAAARYEATHDSLTRLWNRGTALETLDSELARSERQGSPVGVVMADIDHFKNINDTHGHLAGDAVLREIGDRLRATVRAYDTPARYGGEEFLVVLPGCDLPRGARFGERLRTAVARAPFDTGEFVIPVTLSVGVTAWHGASRLFPQRLLQAADKALYRAKERGRNRVETEETTAPAQVESVSDIAVRRA